MENLRGEDQSTFDALHTQYSRKKKTLSRNYDSNELELTRNHHLDQEVINRRQEQFDTIPTDVFDFVTPKDTPIESSMNKLFT